MNDFFVIGLNHKTAPVELREEFLKFIGNVDEVYSLLQNKFHWDEAVFLNTCNRIEFYGIGKTHYDRLLSFLDSNPEKAKFTAHLYESFGVKCTTHLFKVTASLDSMVVGEPQITGQVKEAFLKAKEQGFIGSKLSRLFEKAFSVAKMVRAETEISQRPVSIGSVGVDLAQKIFGKLENKKVLILGAGEMAEQVYKSLQDCGVEQISLANRSIEKAKELLVGDTDSVHSISEIPQLLEDTDLMISSLRIDSFIITAPVVKKIIKSRKGRPLFMIDLGLPRNLDPEINGVANVYLYNIDDLNNVIAVNKNIRQDESLKAYEIVEKEASDFYGFVINKKPTIQMLGRKLDLIRRTELEKTLKQMAHLPEVDKKLIAKLSESLVNKILHDPVLHLRSGDGVEAEHQSHDLIRRLFRLDET